MVIIAFAFAFGFGIFKHDIKFLAKCGKFRIETKTQKHDCCLWVAGRLQTYNRFSRVNICIVYILWIHVWMHVICKYFFEYNCIQSKCKSCLGDSLPWWENFPLCRTETDLIYCESTGRMNDCSYRL